MTSKQHYSLICETLDIPLFAQPWWLDIVCKNWDVALSHNGDKISGAWPYPVEKKIGVSISRLPFLTPYLGPHVIFPADLKKSKHESFEYDTIADLIVKLPAFKVMEMALHPGLKQAGILKNQGFEISARQTFLIDLQLNDEAALLAGFHEDTRRNISKAEKELTITDDPAAIEDLYHFQKATLDRKDVGIPYSIDDLRRLFEACRAHHSTALWVAKKNEVIQGVLWNMWDKTKSYYLVGAKNPASNDKRVMTALIWQAIKHCRALGKSTFDFEGSMIPGVERFFRTFGPRRELYLIIKKNNSLRWKLLKALR